MLEEQKLTCTRCGFTEFVPADKRKRKDQLCADCRRRPAKTINYGLEKSCKPHQGNFDLEDNPIEWGDLYLPGKRVCGHRDCVETSHIIVG
jgi:hypothetical protein